MAAWLKQSTAVDIAMGPFVDSTDGFTPETGLSLTQAETRLKKNAGAWAQKTESTTASHEEEGWYEVKLDATDTDTLGILEVAVYVAGALPVWREFMVLPANIYDSLVLGTDLVDVSVTQLAGSAISQASGLINANVTQVSGDSTAADNLEAEYDNTGFKSYTRRNTAQAGAATTITLDASASAVDDFYNDQWISIHSGTGAGQARRISDYVGSTKVATVESAWATNPDNTSVFAVQPSGKVNVGAIVTGAIASGAIAAAELTNIAQEVLKADWTAITGEASRSLLNAARFLRNKWHISGGTLTVEKEDDSTDAWTGAVSTTAGDPVSSIDPA